MAETKDDIDVNEENVGMSKKLIIIIAAVALLVIGGVAAFLLSGDSEEASVAEEVAPTKAPPIYHAVDQAFIVNFNTQSDNTVNYLQIKLKVMARDQRAIDAFILHTPAIRHELLMLFFSQNYDALNTREGTDTLRQETLDTINTILRQENHSELVEAVYFTSLIMQ